MKNTENTIQYYNEQASTFAKETVNVEFLTVQNAFAEYIPHGGKILDLGCGSGRDTKAFSNMGYKVTAVDGSKELCKLASEYTGLEVINSTFQDYIPDEMFDGIWACASLLHLDIDDIESVISKLSKYINTGGCFYLSFKYGDFSGERNGRFFTDLTEDSFGKLLKKIPCLEIERQYITDDARKDREERWLNVFLIKH